MNDSGVMLIFEDSRGIYIPQNFVTDVYEGPLDVQGVDPQDVSVLRQGPNAEWYWDAWHSVLGSAYFEDSEGNVWRFHQDGDLFAVCDDLMSEEEALEFFGE